MSGKLPVVVQELLQLQDVGIDVSQIGFATLTMQSDKYICVREKGRGSTNSSSQEVVIVNLADPHSILRNPTAAESAIMNPSSCVIALRASSGTVQVFNIEMRSRLKSFEMTQKVIFWKWISQNILALVTESSVFHWTIDDTSEPRKVFDRHSNLAGCQIIDYRSDHTHQWLILVGISAETNYIKGSLQLYSVERSVSQVIEGHAAAFARAKQQGNPEESNFLCFAVRNSSGVGKLYIIKLGTPSSHHSSHKQVADLKFADEDKGDFPVSMQIGDKFGVIYLISKYGYLHLYDLETAVCIHTHRLSVNTIFITAVHEETSGVIGVDRKGTVLSVSVNEDYIVQYITEELHDAQLAERFAVRNMMTQTHGEDEELIQEFNKLFVEEKYQEAAKLAITHPKSALRASKTISCLKQAPPSSSRQALPLLKYFRDLAEITVLNNTESVEYCHLLVAEGEFEEIEKLLEKEKIQCSEEVGYLIKQSDPTFFEKANIPDKVVHCLLNNGEFSKMISYASKNGYSPEYLSLLHNVACKEPDQAVLFACAMFEEVNPSVVDPNSIVDVFMELNMLQQCTAFLLDALKPNRPMDGHLQTRLLEINLEHFPPVADAILDAQMFTHYDRNHIAILCERIGLYTRALEHYADAKDIKRVLINALNLNTEWVISFFGSLSAEDSLDCLKAMLMSEPDKHLRAVVVIASRFYEQLGTKDLIHMFESCKCFEGLCEFLGLIVDSTEDPEVHFKYIEASLNTGNVTEVIRICTNSNCYDPERVVCLLKSSELSDHVPLIIVCDRFDYIHELVLHFCKNNLFEVVEKFVQKITPSRLPSVVRSLLAIDYNSVAIQDLIISVQGDYSMDDLVEVLEERNSLKLLLPLLETRVHKGAEDPPTHTALAKLYINMGKTPEQFLQENSHYDSLVVGRYCEKRDPRLACVAYQRGLCDRDLIRVCNENSFYKMEASYLLARKDADSWAVVLADDNEHRRPLIDQLLQTALRETEDPEQVTAAVKAFMMADLPNELIEILEKLVLDNLPFASNRNLQNLLILTAIKTDQSQVLRYINRLDNYDAPDLANIAVSYKLYEEAITLYVKCDAIESAIEVVTEYLKDFGRAYKLAKTCNQAPVWSCLGRCQLKAMMVKEAVDSFIMADDPSAVNEMIQAAEKLGNYTDLVRYLQMVYSGNTKDPFAETELLFALAKANQLAELEEVLSSSNLADLQQLGDRCFEVRLYEGAKIFYSVIKSFAGLASTLVHLGEFKDAVECAQKAKLTKTWKKVCFACVDAKQLYFAHVCGLQVAVDVDELDDLIQYYEVRGHSDELITLLETALGEERAHMGMYTELLVLYSKFKPSKMREHLEVFWTKFNIPKVLRATEHAQLWEDLVFLYQKNEEYSNALLTIMAHPDVAWEESLFEDLIVKVSNTQLYYTALQFYIEHKPKQINRLLTLIAPRLDHSRAVSILRKSKFLKQAKPYLCLVQEGNIRAVNEALNDVYLEEEDCTSLKNSVEAFENFDAIKLAQQLEKHGGSEFINIATYLYMKYSKQPQHLQKGGNHFETSVTFEDAQALQLQQIEYKQLKSDFEKLQTLHQNQAVELQRVTEALNRLQAKHGQEKRDHQDTQEQEQQITRKNLEEHQAQLEEKETQMKTRNNGNLQSQSATSEGWDTSWSISHQDIDPTNEELGRGQCGIVKVGIFREQRVAVKQLHKVIMSDSTLALMHREFNSMAKLRHPNLLLFIGAVLDHPSGNPFIITEIMDISLRQACEKGQLADKSTKLSVLRDTAAGLNYLHCHPDEIIHRDVSSANVLLESRGPNKWRAKLSDFGSGNITRDVSTQALGTTVYSAPEFLGGNLATRKRQPQTTKMDVFSFGVLSCEVMAGSFPEPDRLYALQQSVSDSSPPVGDLIQICIDENPEDRPSMRQVIMEIDSYMKQCDMFF